MSATYRLITRSDLDGLISAALLKELGLIHDILFAHPKDIQDGVVDVGSNDILACLPPHEQAGVVFNHRLPPDHDALSYTGELICDPSATSTAETIWRHYAGRSEKSGIWSQMLDAAAAINTARLTKADIITPRGWTLLGFLTDSRTGLGRFRHFRISNYQLMLDLVDIMRRATCVDDILEHPDVAERVQLYRQHAQPAREQLVRLAQVTGPLVTLDLRQEREIFSTNRFMVYALFPQCAWSMHILQGRQNANTVLAVGKSILAGGTDTPDIGRLMRGFGGGGHAAMGACQVAHADAERVRDRLAQSLLAASAATGDRTMAASA